MENQEASTTQSLAKILPKLMGFARVAESLANRFKGTVLFGTASGALAAAWLAYFTHGVWHFSAAWALAVGVVLAVPALISGWCWSVLDDAVGLPQRIAEWMRRATDYAGETRERFQDKKETGGGRFKDLWQLGGLTLELAFMGGDARDLLGILGGTLALTNPIFLFALAGSAVAIGILDLGAFVAGLFYLFR